MQVPERKLLFGILLFCAALAVLISIFSSGYFPVQADETDLAWVGKEVASGRIPYGDFFSFVPPATLYGVGAFFRFFGASLANLRFLAIGTTLLIVLFLYLLMLSCHLKAGWAAAAAFTIPSIYLPFWPVPSHHLFAIAFGLAALLAVWPEESKPLRWFLGGALIGLSGMSLQAEGLFFTLYLGARLLTGTYSKKTRSGVAALLGISLPVGVFSLLPFLSRSLGWAYYDLVTWPATYYKQAGGFNDVNPFHFLWRRLATTFPHNWHPASAAPMLLLLTAYSLPLLALIMPALSRDWRLGKRRPSRQWILTSTGIFLIFALYLKGRSDWTHMVFLTPMLLLLVVQAIDWERERLRPRLVKVWLVVALAISLARWPMLWVHSPPLLQRVADTDKIMRRRGVAAVVDLLPGVKKNRLPVLYLGKAGSALYFYWAPDPPPLDWIMPPYARYNAPWEYLTLADFARKHHVPYIVIARGEYNAFTKEPSAISDLLNKSYTKLKDSPWGVIMKRRNKPVTSTDSETAFSSHGKKPRQPFSSEATLSTH